MNTYVLANLSQYKENFLNHIIRCNTDKNTVFLPIKRIGSIVQLPSSKLILAMSKIDDLVYMIKLLAYKSSHIPDAKLVLSNSIHECAIYLIYLRKEGMLIRGEYEHFADLMNENFHKYKELFDHVLVFDREHDDRRVDIDYYTTDKYSEFEFKKGMTINYKKYKDISEYDNIIYNYINGRRLNGK